MKQKNILIITDIAFWKLKKDGGEYGSYTLLKYLSKYFKIDIYYLGREFESYAEFDNSFDFNFVGNVYSKTLKDNLISYLKKNIPLFIKNKLKNYRKPITVENYINDDRTKEFQNILQRKKYDVIIFQYIWYAHLVKYIKEKNILLIIDTIDVIHRRNEKYILNNIPLYFNISKEKEINILNNFDYVLAVQNEEGKYLKKQLNTKVLVTPRPFPIKELAIKNSSKIMVVFFGGSADFNVDAINWFSKEMQDFFEMSNKFELWIYGLVTDYINIKSKNIFIGGKVDNIEEVYNKADIIINPIRFGAGLKIKNVEAMSFGLPLITTKVGKEGLGGYENTCYYEANTKDEFQKKLVELSDYSKRVILSKNAISFVKQNMNESNCYSHLSKVINEA